MVLLMVMSINGQFPSEGCIVMLSLSRGLCATQLDSSGFAQIFQMSQVNIMDFLISMGEIGRQKKGK